MKKIPIWTSKIFLGAMSALFLFVWIRWFVDTDGMLMQYELTAMSSNALNALKTGMGGAILTLAAFILLYFINGSRWLLPIAVSSAAFLLSRFIGIVQDGSNTTIWAGVFFEILIIIAALYLHKHSRKTTNKKPNE